MARLLCSVLVLLAACRDGGGGPPETETAPDAGMGTDAAAPGKDAGGQGGSGPDAAAAGGADRGPPADAPAGPSAELAARIDFFRSEVVHRIEIAVDPTVWQAFLREHRSFGSDRDEHAGSRPTFASTAPPCADVAFHSFGWGSRDENKDKPNLSIDIDRNVPGQSLRGIERMRIKNNGQDVSGLRQAILYQAMREANLMAPRSTYAELFVNGEPYGFYFVEESFTQGFVRERTGNANGPAYEPAGCQGLVARGRRLRRHRRSLQAHLQRAGGPAARIWWRSARR